MTPQQIVGLGVRFFAIFIALQSLKYLINIPVAMANTNLASQIYISYGFGGLCFLVAVLLWFFPMVAASKIVPRTGFENRLNLQAFDAARAGGSLIGLWLFANAIPSILWFLFRGAMSVSGESIVGSLASDEKLNLVFYVSELIISFILIFKSHVFAAIAMRNVDIKHETAE